MNNVLRIVLTVLTVVSTLGMLGLSIFALTIPHFGLFAVCLIIAGGLGFFCVRDAQFFLAKKNAPATPEQK